MKRLITVVILVLVSAVFYRFFGDEETGTGSLTLPQPAPEIGSQAPTFTSPSEEGGEFSLGDDGTYLLTFWSTLNRQSNQARPSFEQLAQEFSGQGVEFVSVYVNSAPERASTDYEVLQDRRGTLTQDYNIKRVPRLFIIEDGRVRLVQSGFYDEDEIREHLNESLSEDR